MKTHRCILSALCVSILLPVSARAADGWTLSDLNPFKNVDEPKPRKRTNGSAAKSAKSDWSLPSLNPWSSSTTKTSTARKPATNEPSTWDKISSGTKNFMAKTKDTLTPWKNDEPATKRPATGLNVDSSTARKPEKKKGILTSWLKGEEELPDRPLVHEWIGLPRPQ